MTGFGCTRLLQIGIAVSSDYLISTLPGLTFRTGLSLSVLPRCRLYLLLACVSLLSDWISELRRKAGREVEKHLNERPFSAGTVDVEQRAYLLDLGFVQVLE